MINCFIFFQMQTLKRPADVAEAGKCLRKLHKSSHFLDLDLDENRLRQMDWKELYEVTEACRRIESLVNDQFQRKYRDTDFTFCPNFIDVDYPSEFNLSPNILRQFGPFLRKLKVYKIHGVQNWQVLFESCTQLKELMVFNCDLKFFKPENCLHSPEFHSLELQLCVGCDEDFSRIIRCCKHLIMHDGRLPCHSYPKLKEVRLRGEKSLMLSLTNIFRHNRQIEKIHIYFNGNAYDLKELVKNCPEIESLLSVLSIRKSNSPEIDFLCRLKNLRHLDLIAWEAENGSWDYVSSTISRLAEQNILESLTSRHHMNIDSCVAICKLSHLKTLKLVKLDIKVDVIVKFVRDLKLKHFQVIRCENVSFDCIALAIQHSRTLETLKFTASDKNYYLEEYPFMRLVTGRTKSGANFPLEFAQIDRQFDRMKVDAHTIEAHAGVIKMKKITTRFNVEQWLDRLHFDSAKDDIYYDRDDCYW